jgi:hypothetical protein
MPVFPGHAEQDHDDPDDREKNDGDLSTAWHFRLAGADLLLPTELLRTEFVIDVNHDGHCEFVDIVG